MSWFSHPRRLIPAFFGAALVLVLSAQLRPVAAAGPGSDAQRDLVTQGKLIFDHTPDYAGAWVGNSLSCADCHLRSGTQPWSSPMIDLAPLFPRYNKRAGRVITLQQRLQECFVRSENGAPPPVDSHTIQALVAYIASLSTKDEKHGAFPGRGLVKLPALTGDPSRGATLYASSCAACHGAEGQGLAPVFPPVWGPQAYNEGAGMNNPAKMAAFVIHNMPQNHPGSLTPQQAFDVAAFIHSQPHPKFNPAYKSY